MMERASGATRGASGAEPVSLDVVARDQGFMLASLGDAAFSSEAWLFEIKYDGVRVFAWRDGDDVELRARSGQSITGRYPEIVAALRALPAPRFLIDGEIVAFDDAGRPSFQRLQARMGLTDPRDVARAAAQVGVTAVFFDCLSAEGQDLRPWPLRQRKETLRLIVPASGAARFGDHVAADGRALFDAVCARGLEGIVAKRADSAYVGGRSRDWIKIKCQRRQDFVIGGYTDPKGSRAHFGALHLGVYEGGRLVYVSKVGTGFDEARLTGLWRMLAPLSRPTPPFDAGAPLGRGHHWVEPRLVCEVRFTEWTRDGGIRHPTFLGLSDDKRPEDCRRDVVAADESSRDDDMLAALTGAPRSAVVGEEREGGWDVPREQGQDGQARPPDDRARRPRPPARRASPGAEPEAFPDRHEGSGPVEGQTNDLVRYYRAVAPMIAPYLRARPLILARFRDGVGATSAFPEGAPAWLRTERVAATDGSALDVAAIDDAQGLARVVDLGAMPLDVWSSRFAALERPDWLVLDLDPADAPFADVVAIARQLHAILNELSVPGYVKTSGGSGLQILVPLGARYSHDEARSFARLIALLAVEASPATTTVDPPPRAQGGKVRVGVDRNGYGMTIAAPYCARPLPGSPVSCPLAWSEVTPALDPRELNVASVPDRVRRLGDPMSPVLGEGIDMAAALERVAERFGSRRPGSAAGDGR